MFFSMLTAKCPFQVFKLFFLCSLSMPESVTPSYIYCFVLNEIGAHQKQFCIYPLRERGSVEGVPLSKKEWEEWDRME